ncbi:hypothetical protein F5Y12DRAFT_720456 [Xylaria sp. FL1777]|nr:hypothetical protein F5Y12DRAFT_720456 [Xylaria sp. FL1777]
MLLDLLHFPAYTDDDERDFMLAELVLSIAKATTVMREQAPGLLESSLLSSDARHWPTLTWSRFDAYSYRDFLAQAPRPYDLAVVAYAVSRCAHASSPHCELAFDYVLAGKALGSVPSFLTLIAIHLVVLALRVSVTVLYTALLSVAWN